MPIDGRWWRVPIELGTVDDESSALDLSEGSILRDGKLVGRYEHDHEYLILHITGEDSAYYSSGFRYTENGLERIPLNLDADMLHDEDDTIVLTRVGFVNDNGLAD